MSDCERNCDQISGLNEAAANLLEYEKRIDKWLNGGQNEFVQVGGVQTPTLLGLAMSIKQLVGVWPDNQTIKIDPITKKIYVDFSSMPLDAVKDLLKTLRLPMWINANLNLYVDSASDGDSLVDGRGTQALPFKHIQNAANYVVDNVNLGNFFVTIKVAAGTYSEDLTLNDYSTSGGYVVIDGQGNVTIQKATEESQNVVDCIGGTWALQNVSVVNNITSPNAASRAYAGIICRSSQGMILQDVHVTISQQVADLAFGHGVIASGGPLYIQDGCSISGNAMGTNALHAISSTAGGNLYLSGEVLNVNGAFNSVAYSFSNGAIQRTFPPLGIVQGSVTGRRYETIYGSSINVADGGPEYFPGTIEGFVDSETYSWYK